MGVLVSKPGHLVLKHLRALDIPKLIRQLNLQSRLKYTLCHRIGWHGINLCLANCSDDGLAVKTCSITHDQSRIQEIDGEWQCNMQLQVQIGKPSVGAI